MIASLCFNGVLQSYVRLSVVCNKLLQTQETTKKGISYISIWKIICKCRWNRMSDFRPDIQGRFVWLKTNIRVFLLVNIIISKYKNCIIFIFLRANITNMRNYQIKQVICVFQKFYSYVNLTGCQFGYSYHGIRQ